MASNIIPRFDRNSIINPNGFRIAFLGSTSAGKTSYLFTLLDSTFVKQFTTVWCVSTKLNFRQYEKFIWPDRYISYDVKNPVTGKVDEIVTINAFVEQLKNFMQNVISTEYEEKNKEKKQKLSKINTLIIFDDCINFLRRKSSVENFLSVCRHYRISVIVLVQQLIQLNTNWRDNLSHLFLFKQKEYEKKFSCVSMIDKKSFELKVQSSPFLNQYSILILTKGTIDIFYDNSDKKILDKKYDSSFLMSTHSDAAEKIFDLLKQKAKRKKQKEAKILT